MQPSFMLTKLSGLYLIIDDDDSLRNLLEVIIESAGGSTQSAGTPKEAIKVVRELGPKITGILLDMNLDQSKGEDLYDELVQIEPNLDFFPMSGCHPDEVNERLGNRPTSGMIGKPFLSADLVSTLANAFASRGQPSQSL